MKHRFISKGVLLMVFLVLWFVFSALYIGVGAWKNFEVSVIQKNYDRGAKDTLLNVIEEAKKCAEFSVGVGKTIVTLANTNCPHKASNAAPSQP